MKDKNYKLQNTNYKQIPNYKSQTTKKETSFGQRLKVYEKPDKKEAAGESLPTSHQPSFYTHPLPNRRYPIPMNLFNVFVILSLWFVCHFVTPLPSPPLAAGGKAKNVNQ
jgi:hypothetical protein